MVSSNLEQIVKLARSYGNWGRDCYCVGSCNLLSNGTCNNRFSNWLSDFPDTIIDHKYVFNRIGWNLKPLDLQAACGREQLKKLEWICHKRVLNQQAIQQIFKENIKSISFPKVLELTDWVPFGFLS